MKRCSTSQKGNEREYNKETPLNTYENGQTLEHRQRQTLGTQSNVNSLDIWHRLKAPWAVTTGQVLPAPCEPVSGMLLSIRQCAGQNKELCGPERQQRNPFYLISKAPVPGPAPGKSYPAQTFLQCERIKCLN